jgi:hypothetical protein
VRLFFFWPRLGLRSLAGKHYRVHTKTTVAAYRALFGLRVIIRDGLAKRKNTVGQHDLPPILVFYDRKDILTASAALGRWLSSQGDKTLYAVSARNRWHHLIIDHRALGAPGWAAMQSQLKKWLILHKL